jgi:hypothetical protein
MRRLSVLLMLAAAALIGVAVAACSESESEGEPTPTRSLTREEALAVTPPPPDPNWTARPNPHLQTAGPTPTAPPSVTISGIEIPIPAGEFYWHPEGLEGWVPHIVRSQEPVYPTDAAGRIVQPGLVFIETGLYYLKITPSEQELYAPTLDALWRLSQKAGMPSPSELSLESVDIPLPPNSYYSVSLQEPAQGGDPAPVYVVQFDHSAVVFDSGGLHSTSVQSADEPRFAPTLEALALLD